MVVFGFLLMRLFWQSARTRQEPDQTLEEFDACFARGEASGSSEEWAADMGCFLVFEDVISDEEFFGPPKRETDEENGAFNFFYNVPQFFPMRPSDATPRTLPAMLGHRIASHRARSASHTAGRLHPHIRSQLEKAS